MSAECDHERPPSSGFQDGIDYVRWKELVARRARILRQVIAKNVNHVSQLKLI